jgi:hypothetical protein
LPIDGPFTKIAPIHIIKGDSLSESILEVSMGGRLVFNIFFIGRGGIFFL